MMMIHISTYHEYLWYSLNLINWRRCHRIIIRVGNLWMKTLYILRALRYVHDCVSLSLSPSPLTNMSMERE